MKSLMIKIKQKFCSHDFELLPPYSKYPIVKCYKCSKCGKIIYI